MRPIFSLLSPYPSTGFPRRAFDLKERVRQSDGVDVGGQSLLEHEYDRHFARLAGRERLLGETETLELFKVAHRDLRAIAWNGLAGDRVVCIVANFVHD